MDGTPLVRGRVILGDVRSAAKAFQNLRKRIKLIVTSPPYLNVTNYEEDQWLRLWFLGYEARPSYGKISRDDRHGGAERYWKFLREAWSGVGPLLAPDAKIVCRIGGKDINVEEVTLKLTDSIRHALPNACLLSPPVISAIKNRQTEAFRPGSTGCTIEVDYVFAA
jgi:DNA modification methylase